MRVLLACCALASWLLLRNEADALCGYHGVLYAKATIAQEFKDSKWVVQAKLMAADDHWSDKDESWTLYHVQILHSYKGAPPPRLDVFTYRDSGGFYLDKGVSNDLGGKYLLFLNPATQPLPERAKTVLEVNDACGRSKPWAEISVDERRQLGRLSQTSDQTRP